MSIFLHVAFALLSIGVTTWSLFRPSRYGLIGSYATIGATIASGVFLVVTMPATLLHTCVVGLVYLGVVVPMSVYASRALGARS